ncbi:hypothetical protein [Pelagerythrobacter sp.]
MASWKRSTGSCSFPAITCSR